MNKTDETPDLSPSELITNRIKEYNDWRGVLYARIRQLINEASPDLKEEWKWSTAKRYGLCVKRLQRTHENCF